MKCRDFQDQMHDKPAWDKESQSHLEGCPTCRREWEFWRAARSGLRDGSPVDLPPFLHARIMAAVRAEKPRPALPLLRFLTWKPQWTAPTLLSALVVFGEGYGFNEALFPPPINEVVVCWEDQALMASSMVPKKEAEAVLEKVSVPAASLPEAPAAEEIPAPARIENVQVPKPPAPPPPFEMAGRVKLEKKSVASDEAARPDFEFDAKEERSLARPDAESDAFRDAGGARPSRTPGALEAPATPSAAPMQASPRTGYSESRGAKEYSPGKGRQEAASPGKDAREAFVLRDAEGRSWPLELPEGLVPPGSGPWAIHVDPRGSVAPAGPDPAARRVSEALGGRIARLGLPAGTYLLARAN